MLTNIKKNIKRSCIALSLPVILIFLAGPLEIYVGNINEFNYNLETLLLPFIALSLFVFFIGIIILSLLPPRVNQFFCYLTTVISLLFYIQNIFFNKYLYSRDGSSMNWSKVSNYSLMANLVWLVLVIVSIIVYFAKDKTYMLRINQYLSIFVFFIQLVSIVSMVITGINNRKVINHAILSGESQYKYGTDNNIIVLIPDRYTNIEFEELIKNYPEVVDDFKDFTYYDNADSCYAYTFPSLTHVLTGVDPDINITRSEWFDYAWNSQRCKNFYENLHSLGYSCRLYSSEEASIVFGNLSNLEGKFDNIENAKPRINKYMLLALYTKMSAYKYVPYCAKPYLEIESSDAFKDIVVYDNCDGIVDYYNYELKEGLNESRITIDNTEDNTFTFMHISGLHERNNDKDGNYVVEKSVSLEETKEGLSKIIHSYLTNLKDAGIYDSSTIIIIGDHGKNPETNGIDPQPVFLIKKANEKHNQMQISSAPISFDDMQATILTCANVDYDKEQFGTSIFEWNNGDERERTLSLLEDGFIQYKYTGNRYVLMDMIKNNQGTHTLVTNEW